VGHEAALLVEALHYKPESWELNPNEVIGSRTLTLGSTQPLTEIKVRPAHETDNLSATCEPVV
jgi:hypothetical protein